MLMSVIVLIVCQLLIMINDTAEFSTITGDMSVVVNIKEIKTRITMINHNIWSAYQWMGIGFDSLRMNNTYSIIWSPIDGISEYILGHHMLLGQKLNQYLNINETNGSYLDIISQITEGNITTIVIERDNKPPNRSYTFSPFKTEIEIIFAHGKTANIEQHDNRNRYFETLISVSTTKMPESTVFNDTNIDKEEAKTTTRNEYEEQIIFDTISHSVLMFIGIGIILPISLIFIRYYSFTYFAKLNVYYGDAMKNRIGGAGIMIAFIMIIFGFIMKIVDLGTVTLDILHHLTGIILIVIFGGILIFGYIGIELLKIEILNNEILKSMYIGLFILCGYLQMISGSDIWGNHVFGIILIIFLCLWAALFLYFEIMKCKNSKTIHSKQVPAGDISDDEEMEAGNVEMVDTKTNEEKNNDNDNNNNNNKQITDDDNENREEEDEDDSEESDLLIIPDYKPTPR